MKRNSSGDSPSRAVPQPHEVNAILCGIIENSLDPIAALDNDFRYIALNSAYKNEFREIFGIEVELGMTLGGAMAHVPGDQATALELARRAMAGEEFTAEQEFGDPSRRRRVYELSINTIRDDEGRQIGAAHIARDVTARRLAEQELARRLEQVRRLAAELSSAEQRERKRIATALHDHLQQILAAARYEIDQLRQGTADGPLGAVVTRLEGLIQESIDASRSLAVELSPPVLYDRGLPAALEWLARHFRDKHGLEVAVDVDSETRLANVDVEAFLFQSVRELLFNIVKHAGTNQAWITMNRGGEQAQITVEDRGRGCDPERFAVPAPADAGFGLFNIQQRIDLLGGRFEAHTVPERGCRVTLAIPLGALEVEPRLLPPPHPAAPAEHLARPDSAAACRRIRVVIADDHKILREGLSGLLRLHGDIEVVGQAEDGLAALELARRMQPDVIVMDVSMPQMDGIEATRAILEDLPETRIIGLSMYEQDDMARAMLNAGAAVYLTKGGPSEILVEAIRGADASP